MINREMADKYESAVPARYLMVIPALKKFRAPLLVKTWAIEPPINQGTFVI